MKNNKILYTHYLSFSYNSLIKHKVIHYILFLIEIVSIFLQIFEIYYNDYKSLISENIKIFSYITPLIQSIKKLNIAIQFLLYIIIIILIIIFSILFNYLNLSRNIVWDIIINLNEIIFYRLGSLIIFHYLFSFNSIFLIIGFILTVPYVLILFNGFNINHLFTFFFSFVKYPYDSFSKIIDIHLLLVKIFLSISAMSNGVYLSKFFFILSILILFFLQIYLTYIMFNKSYFLMNNISLNKTRYSILLSNCFIILLVLINKINEFNNVYFIVCYGNILILSFLLVIIFYDPYKFVKFRKDDNEENAIFYFFILDRDKNKNLLLETKIEEHIYQCGRCNLCKKYKATKVNDKFENIDIYKIIYNNENYGLNLMNKIIREIRKNGKNSIAYNSYFLINLIYIYYIGIIQNDYCFFLNTELIYQLINSENSQYFEDYKIYLNRIKFTNNFIVKAREILDNIYKIFIEKNIEKKYEIVFNLGDLLEELKFKEIKNTNNNIGNYNSANGNSTDKTLNCSNILTICSIFYEELYNESISNSRIYIRDSQNLLDDLINNNFKNHKLITLEITAQNFKVKIARAGGFLNKYENFSLFDLFPEVFKSKQISLMKKILLNSNSEFQKHDKIENNNKLTNKSNKNKENEFQKIIFYFIIEEKEGNNIYYQVLQLDLNLVILKTINTIFYLNGIYKIDKDVIITEQRKEEEYLLHFGNKDQLNTIIDKTKDGKFKIKKASGYKYIGNKKLIRAENVLIGCKHYNAYHFFHPAKKNNFTRSNKNNINFLNVGTIGDKSNNSENNDKLIFNDVASQSSSVTSSISKNNLMMNNRGNKRVESGEDITKNFKVLRYILWIFIFLLIIILVIEYLVLKLYLSNLTKELIFCLSLSKYYIVYCRIFCSILSLSCIGLSSENSTCVNGIKEYSEFQMKSYNISTYENTTEEEKIMKILLLFFVNFEELLFNQEKIAYNILEATKENITNSLVEINQDKYNKIFQSNLTYHKITQKFENNELNLTIKKDKLTFNDAILLIATRCAILSEDIEDLRNPIYILNKFDEKTMFKNINKKNKLNPYQENFYLLLLDHNELVTYLNETMNLIKQIVSDKLFSFKNLVFTILLINVFLYLVIFIILFGFMSIYLIIIFQILKNIYTFLNEKLGDIAIKDIMRKKIDNLKMLLSFYEKDINSTINDLTSIYHNYKESYNLKIKEESKHTKRESMNDKEKESQNNNSNLLKLFKWKNFGIFFTYSTKKNVYKYSIIFLLIFVALIFIVYIIIFVQYLKKQNYVLQWVNLTLGISGSTNLLMTNFLIMLFTNQTFSEVSSQLPNKDFTSYIYDKLKDLYEAGGLSNNFQDLLSNTEHTIEYDCDKFYLNLDYPYYNLLLSKYKSNDSTLISFYFTLSFFCHISKVMTFKNYKTVYMQLYNPIENIMQSFKCKEYSEIIKFIENNNIAGIQIIFFIAYVYLLDLMNTNIQNVLSTILNEINNKIDILGIIFIIAFLHLITSIYFSFTRNINKDCRNFIHMKKIFKVCNINE